MNHASRLSVGLLLSLACHSAQADEPPLEWTDPDTGYHVVRLSRGFDSARSFYFHNKPFLSGVEGRGDQMVFYAAKQEVEPRQLWAMDLHTLETRQLTDEPERIGGEILSPATREAYYQAGRRVMAVHVDTGEQRLVGELPEELPGSIRTVSADGARLLGVYAEGIRELLRKHPKKSEYFSIIYEARLPNQQFTIDVATGETRIVQQSNDWLNHQQFSPTNPDLLTYCHEGPWHKVQRIWLLDLATGQHKPIHERTVEREIAGHEFWSPDGRAVWFDLQIPRGETFYLTRYDLATGQETRYQHERHEWSVHYNISPDQKLFCGDGGSAHSVARSPDGHWIYLFEPDGDRLKSTRLVNLKDHDYELEPNAHFTPDGRWIVFRANLHGASQVYAVDLESGPNDRAAP